MEFWTVRPRANDRLLDAARVAGLLARVEGGGHGLAADLLDLLAAQLPLAQCTVFVHDGTASPAVLSYADRARTRELPLISRDYAARFHALDGSRLAMASREARAGGLLLQRQAGEDIAQPEYRRICYERPRIADRAALLSRLEGGRWLSVNFYRGREHGKLGANELGAIEAWAPLVVQLARLHEARQRSDEAMPALLLARLQQAFPELGARDMDLLRVLLRGADVAEIGEALGIRPASARTYLKRLYRKLGIGGQREPWALLMAPVSRAAVRGVD